MNPEYIRSLLKYPFELIEFGRMSPKIISIKLKLLMRNRFNVREKSEGENGINC